ncbi:MAG: ribosome silencing factor, partial [Kistimonas sp.]|nr:ribosome silencing factor [Kistimonas sp.]
SVLDVSDRTCITDMMIIASGTSTRHLRSLADNLIKACRQDGIQPLGVEGHSQSEWVLVDLGGIVVHLMMPSTRQFYDLERLWETRSPALLANAE